jgi:O-antigen ligase
MVACTIPLFAVIPAAKVLVTPWFGPVKDFVVLGALFAIACVALQREKRAAALQVDRLLLLLVAAFAGLYIVNLGGAISGGGHGNAWAQGVRLIGEPLILLIAGLSLPNPRRTLDVAVRVLIATGVVVALYGLYQQWIGEWNVVALGYSFNVQVRTIGGHLRSFGTLDQPFDYAAMLLLSLSAALFWMRRGPLKVTLMSVMTIGLVFSFVRSALLISVALLALWLVSVGRTALGFLLLAVSLASALALLFAVAGATETRSVRAGPNSYLTLNGRTTVWGTLFAKPSKIPFGEGVGKVGTAAERAARKQLGLTTDPRETSTAVDSGYFAAIADVGIVGLIVLLALLTRLTALGVAVFRSGDRTGLLVLGWLVVLLLDAFTRASFTGFPTAFLGLLLVGVGIGASRQPERARASLRTGRASGRRRRRGREWSPAT